MVPSNDDHIDDDTEPIHNMKISSQESYLLKALLDHIPDYVYFKDTESRFIRTSKAHAIAFGLDDPAEVIGKTDFDFFTEDHARPAFDDEQEIIRTGEPISLEERETWPDRPDTWVLTTKMPLCDDEGNIIGTFGISSDITEQKIAEKRLLREKQFLETLIENSPVAIVIMDNLGRIESCNPAFEEMFGYQVEDILGKDLDLLITTQDYFEEARKFSIDALDRFVRTLSKRKRRDDSLISVQISAVPVLLSRRRIGTFAMYNDVTDLEDARKTAEEANQAKSEFLANMSHEIRTPMNGVIGMLELALDTSLTEEQRDYLCVALQSAESLLTLLNDILDFSKIEAKKLDLEIIDFSLRHMIEDVAYALAKKAEDKGLEIACLTHPDLLAEIKGDPGRLRQILVNLTGNAIKFTKKGEIVIRAEPIKESETHTTIRFSVQDTGIGIPHDRQAAVFERFTQADGSTTRRFGGSGLGLTISKQLVEAMGGEIGLESEPGFGSTFWFIVTFEKQTRPFTPQQLDELPIDLQGLRILGVDDNATNRMILEKMVESFGCRCTTVSSGMEALDQLHAAQEIGDPYRIVFLDMQMPKLDGEETTRMIKTDPVVKDVQVIILTSLGQRGDASRLETLGCSGYLLKPIKKDQLRDGLVAVINREQTGETKSRLITRHVLSEKKRKEQMILLAEDNPVNQKLAVVLLQKAGYSVDVVENGLAAVERVQQGNYRVVLMDVQMPEMDGFEATQAIRDWEQGARHIPIIAMTAHALKGDRERCLEVGMDDYLSKPIKPKEFIKKLDFWVSSRGSKSMAEAEKSNLP